MKYLLFIPAAVLLAAVLGYGAVRAAGFHPGGLVILAAALPGLIAGLTALAPALMQRPFGQASVIQGAFYGMVAHLGLTLALGIGVFLLLPIRASVQPYALWLMWFFWVTLAAVAAALIRLIRSTPVART